MIAALALSWWLKPGNRFGNSTGADYPGTIIEPPIEEQIDAQIAGIKSGKLPPLPIPIYIEGEKFNLPSLDAFLALIKKHGFVLDSEAKDATGGRSSSIIYYKPGGRGVIYILPPSSSPQLFSGVAIHDTQTDYPNDEISKTALSNCGDSQTASIGPIEVGMSLNEVKSYLGSIGFSYLDVGSPEIPELAARSKIEGLIVSRGVYGYSFSFLNGKLYLITIQNSSHGTNSYLRTLPEDQQRRELERKFSKPSGNK